MKRNTSNERKKKHFRQLITIHSRRETSRHTQRFELCVFVCVRFVFRQAK